jgi:hypothetical protein
MLIAALLIVLFSMNAEREVDARDDDKHREADADSFFFR